VTRNCLTTIRKYTRLHPYCDLHTGRSIPLWEPASPHPPSAYGEVPNPFRLNWRGRPLFCIRYFEASRCKSPAPNRTLPRRRHDCASTRRKLGQSTPGVVPNLRNNDG
jgi:hypothetical protein